MSLFSWFERLVNEHGSANIMKDDQLSAKDRKIAELEAKPQIKNDNVLPSNHQAPQNPDGDEPKINEATLDSAIQKIIDPHGAFSIERIARDFSKKK
jgi:hypothetical protein